MLWFPFSVDISLTDYLFVLGADCKNTTAYFSDTLLHIDYVPDMHRDHVLIGVVLKLLQEAQLMLTNPRDAFRGQSRSPNIWYHSIC